MGNETPKLELGQYVFHYVVCAECGHEFKGRNYRDTAGDYVCDACAYSITGGNA